MGVPLLVSKPCIPPGPHRAGGTLGLPRPPTYFLTSLMSRQGLLPPSGTQLVGVVPLLVGSPLPHWCLPHFLDTASLSAPAGVAR